MGEPQDPPPVFGDLNRHALADPAKPVELVMRELSKIPYRRVGHYQTPVKLYRQSATIGSSFADDRQAPPWRGDTRAARSCRGAKAASYVGFRQTNANTTRTVAKIMRNTRSRLKSSPSTENFPLLAIFVGPRPLMAKSNAVLL